MSGVDPAFFESGDHTRILISMPQWRYFQGGSGGMPPQEILKIWVLLHALWCNLERKISGFHIESSYKLGL